MTLPIDMRTSARPDSLPLLSRVAESVYWMGRYIERAENVARYIMVNMNLHLDLPMEPAHQWRPLVDITGDTGRFEERYGRATQANVLEFLTHDAENPNSIFSCLRAARENARSVRESITASMFEQLNRLYLGAKARRSAERGEWPLEEFEAIRMGCHMLQGLTDSTMSHGEAWHFLRMGRKLERADQTSRILDVKYFMLLPSLSYVGTPYDDIHWSAMLTSVSGLGMYRRKYGHILPKNVAEFLVMDPEFPRSVFYCIKAAAESLHAITGTPAGIMHYPSEELMEGLQDSLDYTPIEELLRGGLHEFLDGLQVKMNGIGGALYNDFFAGVPRGPEPQGSEGSMMQTQTQVSAANNN